MRRFFCLLASGLTLATACETGSSSPGLGPQGIHPQPQPNSGDLKFSAPCTANACGTAPSAIASPHCKPEFSGCAWSDDTSVSYRQCADGECGVAPSREVCPGGTTFKGNVCGAENKDPCRWRTTCVPPRSTTPCPNADGCGPKPEIGVVCDDGTTGDLACMQLASRCGWQRTCD